MHQVHTLNPVCAHRPRALLPGRTHSAVSWRTVAPYRGLAPTVSQAWPIVSQCTPGRVAAHARPCRHAHACIIAPCRSSLVTIQGLYRNTSPCLAPYRSPSYAVSRHDQWPNLLPVTIQDFVSRHSLPGARPSPVTIQLIVS